MEEKEEKYLEPLTPPDLERCQAEKPNGVGLLPLVVCLGVSVVVTTRRFS